MDAGARGTVGEAKEEAGVAEEEQEEEVLSFLHGWGEEKPQVMVEEVMKDGAEEEEMREAEEQMWGVGEVVMKGEVVEAEEWMVDQG